MSEINHIFALVAYYLLAFGVLLIGGHIILESNKEREQRRREVERQRTAELTPYTEFSKRRALRRMARERNTRGAA